MKKVGYFLCVITLFYSIPARCLILKWDIPLNERLEIVRTADVEYYVNSSLKRIYQERNIIDLTCYAKKDKVSKIRGLFSIYRRESGNDVFLLKEQYISDFSVNSRGRMKLAPRCLLPNLRHIPTFPADAVKEGDSWRAPANLILRNFSIPLNLMLEADYTLTAVKKIKGRDIAVINYHFIINKDLTGRRFPADYPRKIFGQNAGTIFWDIKLNAPYDIKDRYNIMFVFRNGIRGYGSIEFKMDINSKPKIYKPFTDEDKETAKRELQKELTPDKNIVIDTEKRGLVLRLGEILFDFDSDRLKDSSKDILNRIITVLRKKYPDREIIIEGHTDITGETNYNKELSYRRARSVAEYFKQKGGHDKLSYRGFGSEKPVADNRTKEGRQKNRRVEIIIKLN